MPQILKNPFVGWLLLVLAVAAFLKFSPGGDWMMTAEQKRVHQISEATEDLDLVTVAQMVGMASGISTVCGFEFNRDVADIALHTKNGEWRHVEAGGALHPAYIQGFNMSNVRNCGAVMKAFGSEGNVIPMLLSE